MTETYIFDAAATPRGRCTAENGSLHKVAPIELSAGTLRALAARNDFEPPNYLRSLVKQYVSLQGALGDQTFEEGGAS